MTTSNLKFNGTIYPPEEEKFNVNSHLLGIILSVPGFILLLIKALSFSDIWMFISFGIYGLSMITLYTASTIYHKSKEAKIRNRLNIFDHSSIYILIAGTYTPFALVTLNGFVGWVVFAVVWAFAIVGVSLKLFFTGRFQLFSTLMYILMGWLIIGAIKPLVNNLSTEGLIWLFSGGAFYTLGAVFFSIKKIKFNHAIFHVFVLLGSICHYISIYFYVIPIPK